MEEVEALPVFDAAAVASAAVVVVVVAEHQSPSHVTAVFVATSNDWPLVAVDIAAAVAAAVVAVGIAVRRRYPWN